jgi:hypothetical protein
VKTGTTNHGVVIDGTARNVDEPIERAANGELLPAPSATAGMFLDMLEDGNFTRELHEQLREVARGCRAVGEQVGKAKGKVKIDIEL